MEIRAASHAASHPGARGRRRAGACALLASALVLVGCIAAPVGSAVPASVAALSPTLNPNQIEQQRRSSRPTTAATSAPTPSRSPGGSPTPRPTPSPFASDLEALLPAELRGVAMQRFSFPASSIPASGDMCSWVCPGEPQALAAELGVGVARIDVAVAGPTEGSTDPVRVGIVAYRVGGVATSRLVEGRIASLQREGMPRIAVPFQIGGKAVTWATYSLLPSEGTMEYLYAHGGVLYRVVDGVDRQPGSTTPPDTVLALRALP